MGFGNVGKSAQAQQQQPAAASVFNLATLDDPTLLDYSQGPQGLPWIDNEYILELVDFEIHDGYQFKGPRALLRCIAVDTPEAKRQTPEGKIVKAMQPGEEAIRYFDVNKGVVNRFDVGKKNREDLSKFAAALAGLTQEEAQERMQSGDFSVSAFLKELIDATPEEIGALHLRVHAKVVTGTTPQSKKFYARETYFPCPEEHKFQG